MKRTTLLATALALTATTLLTACGSSGGTGGTIDTGEDSAGKSPSTDRPSPTEGGHGRPHIDVDSDLTLSFEPEHTGDPEKDAVLADNKQQIRAVDQAINDSNANLPALDFYLAGRGLVTYSNWIERYKAGHLGVTGKFAYFKRRVAFNKDGSASLIYCGDEAHGFSKDLRTGKVKKTPVSKSSYVLYNTRQVKNKHGVWQMSQLSSQRGAAQCQR